MIIEILEPGVTSPMAVILNFIQVFFFLRPKRQTSWHHSSTLHYITLHIYVLREGGRDPNVCDTLA